jgi:hypothetical protein
VPEIGLRVCFFGHLDFEIYDNVNMNAVVVDGLLLRMYVFASSSEAKSIQSSLGLRAIPLCCR